MVEIELYARREVTGTLSWRFTELPDLQVLDLEATEVSGNIEVLKNLRKLTYLGLRNTQVIGNIEALKNLRELRSLYLARTNVIGDMSALRSTSLEDDFFIEGTDITCEDAALRTVLLKLGLQAEQLTDLKNFEGVKRMLSCRNMKVFLSFFWHMIWRIKLDHESCLARVTRSCSVGSRRVVFSFCLHEPSFAIYHPCFLKAPLWI